LRLFSSKFTVYYQTSAMTLPGLKSWLVFLATLPALYSSSQSQSCPLNIDFSSGSLLHWQAYTGNNKDGNTPDAIKLVYDSAQQAPGGTIGAVSFPEYNLAGVDGIRVITTAGSDVFGGFPTIPTINGYAYHYSILLGSTSISNRRSQSADPNDPQQAQTGAQGGYVRGIRYLINVPPGPTTVPYTMTYAYAMVLENGAHASLNQPMSRAIVSTPAGVIDCASPEYYLPTNGSLDSATARANGFTPSPVPTPNESFNTQTPGTHLQDVWTKGWTEVTFDLSPYRGQQISLTFEADNCVPGGHFAYAYFALRNVCAGLEMVGDTITCRNSLVRYYVPSLNGASYDWSVPGDWTIVSDSNSNTVDVKAGPQPGWIVAREKNSCTLLTDSLFVHLYKGALPQATIDPADTTICYGQTAPLHALVTTGTDYNWVSSGSFSGDRKGNISSIPFATDVVAEPVQSTNYILNLHNADCPLPVADTFRVTVVPLIKVNPGNDTLVVIDEPLQFHATSTDPYKDNYEWYPSEGLSDPTIANPVGRYESEITGITYQVKATDTFGCTGMGTVKVVIAHSRPDIFVPSAFTPGAGSNNLFRPICFGIATLEYFRVYNRWGQLVFGTTQMGQGWDGRIQGRLQESNAYLWISQGTDYLGHVISRKGTVILIR
jgi:hypothetical protein